MYFSAVLLSAALLASSALAGPITARDDSYDNGYGNGYDNGYDNGDGDNNGYNNGGETQTRICPNLPVRDGGCIRYVRGFDVTGVVTEVDLTFPLIQDECDCIQQCLDRPTTCAAYVWKFSTADSVQAGHRTCTLYSQFNLPTDVTIDINLNSTLNQNINAAELVALGNNPQAGAPVPQTFMDINLNTTADWTAVSGEVWQLANGQAVC